MKKFCSGSFVCVAVLACLIAAPLFSQERASTVKGIIGDVKILSSGGRKTTADRNDVSTWPSLRINMPLREKDVIATMAESEARIEIADGSIIKVGENTTVEMATLRARGSKTNTKVIVSNGSIVTNVKKLTSNKSSFEFETPTATAAIRGTFVEIDAGSKGTRLKTFEGVVQVAPAGSKNWMALEDFQMAELTRKQKRPKVSDVPPEYRPKSTRLRNEEETSALTGYVRVMTQYSELEQLESALRGRGIPSAIGIGESSDELTARKIATDDGRSALASAIGTQVQRLGETYAQNVGGEAKKMWEQVVRQTTDVEVKGSTSFKTITQYNPRRKVYKIYMLMVLNPALYKQAVTSAISGEELELRVKKDDMLKKLDSAIKEFEEAFEI